MQVCLNGNLLKADLTGLRMRANAPKFFDNQMNLCIRKLVVCNWPFTYNVEYNKLCLFSVLHLLNAPSSTQGVI